MYKRAFFPILFGALLIALITPVTQFLTYKTAHASVETAVPVAWALGLVFAFVLAAAAFRTVSKLRLLTPQGLAIVYAMLAIAVPLMNQGLIRQWIVSLRSTQAMYVEGASSTYRTAYEVLERDWYPLVPTPEGLAWNKADRLLRLFVDEDLLAAEENARRTLLQTLGQPAVRRAAAEGNAPPAEAAATLEASLQSLGINVLRRLSDGEAGQTLRDLGFGPLVEERLDALNEKSKYAARTLPALLGPVSERVASNLPSVRAKADRNSVERLDEQNERLSAEERSAQAEAVAALQAKEAEVRRLVGALSRADLNTVRQRFMLERLQDYGGLDEAALNAIRHDFVYRLPREERARMIHQDGSDGAPNQNLGGLKDSLWATAAEQQEKRRQSFGENLSQVVDELPWHLYTKPILMWGSLFLACFLFLMALAEWLRRKWVDKENLAFPLVEVVDNIIRHDCALEQAAEIQDPPKRRRLFDSLFAIGALVGFVILSAEALGHYGFIGTRPVLALDLNTLFFTTGAMREIGNVWFVLSPIVIGIVFLLALEVGFSIWVTSLLYLLVTWWIQLGIPDVRDSMYAGFGGGATFPFPAEQLVGAVLAYSLFMVWKAWPVSSNAKQHDTKNAYVPRWVARALFVLMPIAIFALLWNFGVTSPWLLGIMAVVILAQSIASARVRAETGLPSQPATYEFTKLPMVLGLTGMAGSKAFAAYAQVVFLPGTLLFRSLGQQLENIELARRYRLPYAAMGAAALVAFLVAFGVGVFTFLIFAYLWGDVFYGASSFPLQGSPDAIGVAFYPLWVSHFLGEAGLAKFDEINTLRVAFMGAGFVVVAALLFLRQRFLKFPLHPVGYLVLLFSIYLHFSSNYYTLGEVRDQTYLNYLWGSALVAWLIKKMVVKYGGMNSYKKLKPLFIGLVAGSVMAIFCWNMADVFFSFLARQTDNPEGLLRVFSEQMPFIPKIY